MATYDNDLRLKEIATGDESGTWGTSTNTNLELIADSFSYGTKQMSADANETFTMADAASDTTRSLYLKITSAVSLTTTREVTLGPNTISKVWLIENATSGSQIITIKQGSGATVDIPNGSKVFIATDGNGAGAVVYNASPTAVTSVGGTGTVNGISLSGTVTSSGNLTLGGTLANVDLTSQVTGTLPVTNGGTGAATLTANNVILGNGTSAVQAVAPGASGNILTSDGTTWTSSAAGSSLDGRTNDATTAPNCSTALGSGAAGTSTAAGLTAIGFQAGGSTSAATNSNSIYIGNKAGLCAEGCQNVAVGFCSLFNGLCDLAIHNVALGVYALSRSSGMCGFANTAVGACAGRCMTSGNSNTAVGFCSLRCTTSGVGNVGVGAGTLQCHTTGDYNIAIGSGAGRLVTTGNDNIAIGRTSLYCTSVLTPPSSNIAIGQSAGQCVDCGSSNILIGVSAGSRIRNGCHNVALGVTALGNGRCDGGCNTAVGYRAGSSCSTAVAAGCNNVALGFNAGRSRAFQSDNPSGGFVDMNTPTVLCDHIIMGNKAHTCAMIQIGWTTVSDCRDKSCFKEVPHGLDFVNALKPTEYQFKKSRDSEETDGITRYGFLAQDVLGLEGDSPVVANATDPEKLKYTEAHMVPVLVKAIQELSAEVKRLKES